jgi:hypothetical protein
MHEGALASKYSRQPSWRWRAAAAAENSCGKLKLPACCSTKVTAEAVYAPLQRPPPPNATSDLLCYSLLLIA